LLVSVGPGVGEGAVEPLRTSNVVIHDSVPDLARTTTEIVCVPSATLVVSQGLAAP
jgi:hypothetical protein